MDSETSGYVEKAAFSEYFCIMFFCALGSMFGSISQQFFSQFAAQNPFFEQATGNTKHNFTKIIKMHIFIDTKHQRVWKLII